MVGGVQMNKGVIIGISIFVALIVGGFKIYTAEMNKQAAQQQRIASELNKQAAQQRHIASEAQSKKAQIELLEKEEKIKLEKEGDPDIIKNYLADYLIENIDNILKKERYLNNKGKSIWQYENYKVTLYEESEESERRSIDIESKNGFINILVSNNGQLDDKLNTTILTLGKDSVSDIKAKLTPSQEGFRCFSDDHFYYIIYEFAADFGFYYYSVAIDSYSVAIDSNGSNLLDVAKETEVCNLEDYEEFNGRTLRTNNQVEMLIKDKIIENVHIYYQSLHNQINF